MSSDDEDQNGIEQGIVLNNNLEPNIDDNVEATNFVEEVKLRAGGPLIE